MFERFTDQARRVVVLAQEEARLLDHGYIGTEHLLLGLIHEGEGVAARVLERLEISLLKVRSEVEEIIGRGGSAPVGHIPFTPRAKKVLEMSLREALALGHNYIGTEHMLLGLVREGEGVAAVVLVKLGADLHRVREAVTEVVGGDVVLAAPLPGPGRHLRLRLRSGRIDLSIEDLAFSALPSLEVVVREPEAVARGSGTCSTPSAASWARSARRSKTWRRTWRSRTRRSRRPTEPGDPVRSPPRAHRWLRVLVDLFQLAGVHVVDEAPARVGVGDEGAGLDPGDRLADVLVGVGERLQRRTGGGCRSRRGSCAFTSSSVNVTMPQSVWWMRMISRVPSRRWEIASERIASSVTTPPALRMTWASPSLQAKNAVDVEAGVHAGEDRDRRPGAWAGRPCRSWRRTARRWRATGR